MEIKIGEQYLITIDEWFLAPDGEQYRAAFGTVTKIANDNEVLGIKTNRGSTNWFVIVGDMIIAGCQIHYCIKTNKCSRDSGTRDIEKDSTLIRVKEAKSRIYMADGE